MSGTITKWLKRILLFLGLLVVPLIVFYLLLLATNGKLGGVVALVISLIILGIWIWLLHRKQHNRKRTMYVTAMTLIPTAFCAYLCIPVASRSLPEQQLFDAAPTQYWQLSTGSKIAYYYLPAATKQPEKATILFLHGGPGASISSDHIDYFKRFTEEGFEVYLYDQAGSGRSDLLNKSEYSHNRNVDDLAEIVQHIDSDNIALIGHSYGGTLAASAVADNRISPKLSNVVFSEPGPLPMDYTQLDQYLSEHVPSSDYQNPRKPSSETPRAILTPRILLGVFALPRGNEFLPQEEATNVFEPDDIQSMISYSYCPDEQEPPAPITEDSGVRLNPVANALISSSQSDDGNAFNLGKFETANVPGMLLLGECSYIFRRDQLAFLTAYSQMERVQYIENFGHSLLHSFEDGRDAPFKSILAFLEDKPAPLPNYPRKEDLKEFVEADK